MIYTSLFTFLYFIILFADPATPTTTVLPWNQCGGTKGLGQCPFCRDGQWDKFECQDGSFCKRSTEKYWQCIPTNTPSDASLGNKDLQGNGKKSSAAGKYVGSIAVYLALLSVM